MKILKWIASKISLTIWALFCVALGVMLTPFVIIVMIMGWAERDQQRTPNHLDKISGA